MLNSYVDINQINGPSVKVRSHMYVFSETQASESCANYCFCSYTADTNIVLHNTINV